MSYTFEITNIAKLARARVGVLDGKLLTGSVTTGSVAELVHKGQRIPLHVKVKGVVLNSSKKPQTALSLTVDLNEKAMEVLSIGDRLVCA